jgi:stress-induced morphogen
MERKFGAELEMTGISKEQAVRALRSVNINVRDESYNHQTRDYWKIVPDGSVSGGFEVVSPILEGEAGLEQLRIVATALDDAGGTVNRTCGYHVHFDAADLSVEHVRAIVTRYAKHENEIDAFMPASRRGSANTYCKSVASLTRNSRFLNAADMRALVAAQGDRYFKVNLQSYYRHGTVEFRQHSGTLNAAKAVNWVRFLNAFIEATKASVDAPAPVAASVQIPALRGVLGQLAELFRQGDVTLDTMVERFGWQAHSARAAVTRLRKAGMVISCRDGNVYTLRAEGQAVPAARQEDSLWAGIADSLHVFYRNRAAVLAVAA